MKHLVDKLEIAQGNNNADELIPEAIAMLRQQQAEIEALEASKDRLIKTLLDVRGQQPAAWGMTWKDGEIYDVISPAQHDKVEGDYNIPLYIHPVKELTDAEIWGFMDEIEALVHGDIKRAMYRMARKVESILNE